VQLCHRSVAWLCKDWMPSGKYRLRVVDRTATMEEVESVYRAKVKFAHLDTTQDPEEKIIRTERSKRLNVAYELNQKARE